MFIDKNANDANGIKCEQQVNLGKEYMGVLFTIPAILCKFVILYKKEKTGASLKGLPLAKFETI